MRLYLLILLLTTVAHCLAQETTAFYDYQWKVTSPDHARFLGIVKKTDSGYLRSDYYVSNNQLQMLGLYADSACNTPNGYFHYFYPSGKLSKAGRFINRKPEGLWIKLSPTGMLIDSAVFEKGVKTGVSLEWYSNGYISDSISRTNDGRSVNVGWFDNGVPSYAGRQQFERNTGRWQYFHRNGNIAAIEEFDNGFLIDRKYFEEDGSARADTGSRDRSAEFIGGHKMWQKFIDKHLAWPMHTTILHTNTVTIVIVADVDEEGTLCDLYVETPFDPSFDNEAIRVMKRSPKWNPAISHNRRVRMTVRQALTFTQAYL